ncbi:MAG: biotin carboxylase N-terminal domain-containing protein [Mangrovibacterium sp.]
MRKTFHKILIANRGEIAVRIIRTAHRLGIKTVAVYAADDAQSLHVQLAGEAFLLPGSVLAETYLNQEKLVELAVQCGAEAIHPGYGFLSENAAFAHRVEEAGLAFIGATPAQISLMGEKTQAINLVKNLGVPVIPGTQGAVNDIIRQLASLQFPLLVKASAGGGGKGMQIIENAEDLPLALQRAQRQANEYFGNSELFVEKYLPHARHIEVQLMGDGNGNAVHLFERECSIQRRYQKLIEEAPAASVSAGLKRQLYEYALRIAKAVNYRGAGTIEFLVDEHENCYFLEMNTRLQVEHPVTEAITGLDLVEWQLEIAAGNGLPMSQGQITQTGHALEVRICAEDPEHHFVPSSGNVLALQVPEHGRWDSFLVEKMAISPAYDSLLGKLIAHAPSRAEALAAMENSLSSLLIGGIKTNQSFLRTVVRSEAFRNNSVHTRFLENQLSFILDEMKADKKLVPVDILLGAYVLHHFYRPALHADRWGQSGHWRMQPSFCIEYEDKTYPLTVRKGNNHYLLKVENEPVALSDVLFTNNQLAWKRNGEAQLVFVVDVPGATLVQYGTCQFELKSRHVPDQIKLKRYTGNKNGKAQSQIFADLFGKVIDVLVVPGDRLTKGQNLLVIESMKTEFTIQSPVDAVVKTVHVSKGNIVQDKEILVDLES